jgi:uncharacterized protein YndB with AHSA1/START domain
VPVDSQLYGCDMADDAAHPDSATVTRSVDIAAGGDDVWRAIADPDRRGDWLDDTDAVTRTVRVDEVDAGRRMVWTWWRPGGEPDASTVEIALRPLDDGRTRVVVTERLVLPATTPRATSAASSAWAATAAGRATARASARLRWDHRLLGLELQFIGVLAGVG